MSERDLQIDELKRLIEILPDLENKSLMMELSYKRLIYDGYGGNNVGYAYLNWDRAKAEFEQCDRRRWELIEMLQLNCTYKGIPDFGESTIKPYGWDRTEMRDFSDCNSPIGLP